jgi:hypothetical protein
MIIPMTSASTFNTCLTFGQLRDYSLNKGTVLERASQYQHISQCELCACAVNGFTAMPFTIAEVNAIHHQVNVKANATHANPLTFARVLFALFCVAGIIGFYYFADSFSAAEKPVSVQSNPKQLIAPVVPDASLRIKSSPKPVVVNAKQTTNEQPDRANMPVDEIEHIPASLETKALSDADKKLALRRSDVIYIYDLKITDYDKLYFNFEKGNSSIRNHTPPYRENDSTVDYLADDDVESVAADKVLKTGLNYFSRENYSKALEQFLLLRENNPGDANALFYGGLCCSSLGKNNGAIRCFEAILEDPDSPFYEEAKWNLALTDLKIGETAKAIDLFSAIAGENGFYSKKAAEKLGTFRSQ